MIVNRVSSTDTEISQQSKGHRISISDADWKQSERMPYSVDLNSSLFQRDNTIIEKDSISSDEEVDDSPPLKFVNQPRKHRRYGYKWV